MAHIMIMPLLAETMDEGTIGRWLINEGQEVKKGDPVVEVETDKANMEVTATASGVLRRIVAPEGATVPVNDPIAIIAAPDEALPDVGTVPATAQAPALESEPAPAAVAPAPASSPEAPEDGRLKISPRARKLAAEKGLSLQELAGRGSGPGGRIVEDDVTAYLSQRPSATPLASRMAAEAGASLAGIAGSGPGGKIYSRDIPSEAAPSRVLKMTGMRRTIAERLSASARSAVQVTLSCEVDMSACRALRERLLPLLEKKAGLRLSYNDIIIKAVAVALADMPLVNSTFDGEEITLHEEVNLGVAVALDEGLVVPVLRRADRLGLAEIAVTVREMVEKARNGKLTAADMSDGTFTVTNLGTYGVEVFTPIINTPQSCILGVGAIIEKPAVVDGEIMPRPLMALSLVFDHRVLDGAPAARFMAQVKALLEEPGLMLV